MSQAGYTPIQLYYSTTAAATPSAGNLANGELALNITDGKLFYKDNGGVVRVLATAASSAGDVVGPGSSTDNALVRFDGTTGKLVQNSAGILDDSGNLTGLNSITLSTALSIAYGGSGATTAQGAMNAFAGAVTSGQYLRGNGTNVVMSAIQAADVPTLNQNTTGTAAGLSATLNVASGGTGVTTSTGSGSVVLSTSPTLVTPVLGTPTSGTLSNCTVDGTNEVGFKNIPQNSQSAAYTLVLADAGKHILHPSTDANARTFTIPANSSVAYPIGTAITFVNMTSQVVTIAITSDTLTLSPAGTSGSRSLAQYGSATALKIGSTQWLISGSGLT